MTARAVALWVIVALSAVSLAGLAVAFAADRKRKAGRGREALASVVILGAALGIGFAFWAGTGWAWWLSGGTVR